MKKLLVLFVVLALITSCGFSVDSENEAISRSGVSDIGKMKLPENLRECYDDLDKQVYALRETVPIGGLTENELRRVIEYYRADHPQVFWLGNDYSYSRCIGKNEVKNLKLSYKYFDSENKTDLSAVKQMNQKMEQNANAILSGVSSAMSEYDILLYLHDYLIENIAYDEGYEYSHTAYGALVGERAVCDGYANALMYLLNRLGMESRIVYGSDENGIPHAWNIVRVEGEYYHVDLTWDLLSGEMLFPIYTNFNITEQKAREKRVIYSPKENKEYTSFSYYLPIPECVSEKYQYYRYNDCLIKEYPNGGKEKIIRKVGKVMKENQTSIQFLFDSNEDFRQCWSEMTSGEEVWSSLLTDFEIQKCDEESLILFFHKDVSGR